jgi:hypothetical protein
MQSYYVGLDLPSRKSVFVVENEAGVIVARGSIPTTVNGLKQLRDGCGLPAATGVALETGTRQLQVVARLIDGVQFGAHVVLAAVGVDAQGAQHVLGLREGATENAAAGRALLADLAERGLATGRSLARRDRGGQSAAPGGGGGVRRAGPASALPRAQETHCYRRPAGAAARFNPQRHESSLRDALTPSAPGASARGSPGGLNISIRAPRPRCARGGRKR